MQLYNFFKKNIDKMGTETNYIQDINNKWTIINKINIF